MNNFIKFPNCAEHENLGKKGNFIYGQKRKTIIIIYNNAVNVYIYIEI